MARSSPVSVAALCALALLASGLASCAEDAELENAATNAVELARYLPEDSTLVHTIDVADARKELGLPDDVDAAPADDDFLRDRESPQSKLFRLTSRAFPIVRDAYAGEFNAQGASPLDGTLLRAAVYDQDTSIVSTAEPFDQIVDKLERTGYSLANGLYVAGQQTPATASPIVAEGSGGRVVFAREKRDALEILGRIEDDAEPGVVAAALDAVNGSVRLATTGEIRSRCVEALAAAQSATGKGAIMAITVSGEKPDPDRFDSRALKELDIGTTSVLVDSLVVPYNVRRSPKRATAPIEVTEPVDVLLSYFSYSKLVEIRSPGRRAPGRRPRLTPADAYECP